MHTVEDYLAKVDIDKVLYINKIPIDKIIPEDIPSINPRTLKYKQFWKSEAEKCIDGFWVEHQGLHKYVPGVLYFYGAHWHILLNPKNSKSKTKKIERPFIRDLEWIKSYLYLEARGFSGFVDDDEYSCHRQLELPETERMPEFLRPGCYRKDGSFKKYIPAREYLWKYHNKPLGKALFENSALNVVDLESRGCLAKGTKVRMFDGSVKSAEDIVVGDELMGKDFTSRVVLGTYKGKSKMYKLVHDDTSINDLEVNYNHNLSIYDKRLDLYTDYTVAEIVNMKNSYFFDGIYRYDYKKTKYKFDIIESDYSDFYGFQLNLDNEYQLEDGTIDHNTGKSYFMSALSGHNFLFDGAQDFEEFWESNGKMSSETLVGAIDSKYSSDLIKKIQLGLNSLEGEYTLGNKVYPPPFQKLYSGTWDKTIIQEVKKKIGGQWKKVGSKSKFQHRSFMDNEFAANGTRGSFNVIDEVGFMGNLLPVLVQMKECTGDGADKFGTIWMTGTGGDMDGGATEAVMKVFYDPEVYECVKFTDYYEGSEKDIGFFIPAWMGLNQFKDDLGNTNYKQAIQFLLNARAKLSKGKDKGAYNGELSQRPIIPSEVFLISGGNILPIGQLKDQLSFLEATSDPKYEGVLGHMTQTPDGDIKFIPDTDNKLQVCDWPVKKGEDHSGAVQIWEQPCNDIGFGYYLAGNDPYDQDKAPNSVSLGSLLIMKRCSPGVSPYDMIVAEYTARPETAKDYYEQCRLLLMYYNTIGSCLYENEKIGIKTYLENTNSLHFLAPTPTVMKSNMTSNVNRGLGQHMSTNVKDECEIFLRDWLVAPAGDGKLNLHHIYSKPLLRELVNYNKTGNFDRVIALMLCVVQLTQMHKIIIETAEEEAEEDNFFNRPLFGGRFDTQSFGEMIRSNTISSNFS